MSFSNLFHHAEGLYNKDNDGTAHLSPEKTIDETCRQLLDTILPRSGGAIFDARIILELKEIFESQHFNLSEFGMHHRFTLTTPLLTHIIHELICNDFFKHHNSTSHFDLELHLRCIVAALKLLSVHGIQAGSGTLTFAYFDELYNRMANWKQYDLDQVQGGKTPEASTRNYNNDFLIVYATDLIRVMPSDRTLVTNVMTRIVSATMFVGQAYEKNVVEAVTNLKKTVQVKFPPSSWHKKFRELDDLCLSIRICRERYSSEKKSRSSMDDIVDVLNDTEASVVNDLNDIVVEQLKSGLGKDHVSGLVRTGSTMVGTAPVARKDHFIYGILDLIQQHVETVNSGKVHTKVMHLAIDVARISKHSYLRCKAFELLVVMSSINGVGQTPIKQVLSLFSDGTWNPSQQNEAWDQWYVIRDRVARSESYFIKLRNKRPKTIPRLSIPSQAEPAPMQNRYSFEKILDLLCSLDETLVCPIGTEKSPVEDLSELPCGHFVSLRAWRRWESEKPGEISRCPQCNAEIEDIKRTLPMGRIGEIIRGIREECRQINGLLGQNRNPSSGNPGPPTRGADKETPETSELLLDFTSPAQSRLPQFPMAPQNSTSTNTHDEKHTMDLAIPPPFDKPPPYYTIGQREQGSPYATTMDELSSLFSQSLPERPRESVEGAPNKEAKETEKDSLFDSAKENQSTLDTTGVNHTSSSSSKFYSETNRSNVSLVVPDKPAPTQSDHENLLNQNTTGTEPVPLSRAVSSTPSTALQFRRDKVEYFSLGSSINCQATAVSATCKLLALVSSSDFSIYTLSDGDKNEVQHELTCWGSNDGRFGKSRKTATTSLNELNSPRDSKPTYQKAVLSDKILYVAGRYHGTRNGCIDTHDTKLGHRIATFEFYDRVCWIMEITSKGDIIAVGSEEGQLSLYRVLPDGHLATWSERTESIKEGSINCIAFTQDSAYMSICTSRNVIRTYHLGGDSPTLVSMFPRRILSMDPYCGVTGLAFSSESALLVVADARAGYPIVIKNVTSQSPENFDIVHLQEYGNRNFCAAYSPISNAALMITVDGRAILVNCIAGKKSWTVDKLEKRCKFYVDSRQWRLCSLTFSEQGDRALILDGKGKLLVIKFSTF